MHPFEIYKFYQSLKIHFTSNTYFFDYENYGLKHFKFSNFDASENYKLCLSLQKYTKEELFELFVSNMIKSPKKILRFYLNSSAYRELLNWKGRMNNLSEVIQHDFENILFPDAKNFKKLKILLYTRPQSTKLTKIQDFSSILDSSPKKENYNYLDLWINDCYPETMSILHEMYFRKYHSSFLTPLFNVKYKPYDSYLKIFKYSSFLNFSDIFEMNIVKLLYSDI